MTSEGIEAFLTICRYGTMTRAAERLYINQSALSARIRTLENELGQELFIRGRGQREVKLTPAGELLYPMALEYRELMNNMHSLSRNLPNRLTVATLSSLGTYLMPEVWEIMVHDYPQVELVTRELSSSDAAAAIARREIDMGFATRNINNSSVRSTLVFEEPMVMITAKDSRYPELISLNQLDPRKEIYNSWCDEFEDWHNAVFGPDSVPHISLDLMEPMRRFLKRTDNWAIVPLSPAKHFMQFPDYRQCQVLELLPTRPVYCMQSTAHGKEALVEMLLSCLNEVLDNYPDIHNLIGEKAEKRY